MKVNSLLVNKEFKKTKLKKDKEQLDDLMSNKRWKYLYKFVLIILLKQFLLIGGRRGTRWEIYYNSLYNTALNGEIDRNAFI